MNVKIKALEYYHPEKIYTNDYFVEHFEKQGIDIQGLLKVSGRKQRFISENPNENTLTMAISAASKAVNSAGIDKDKIDLVVSVATTPEFLAPTNAVKIHTALNLNKRCSAYDMNGECTGLILALDQISRVMKGNNRIRYALLVGADQLFRHSDPTNALTYTNFAESACALVLENIEDSCSDYIDSSTFVFNKFSDSIIFPLRGLSKTLAIDCPLTTEEKKIQYDNFDGTETFDSAVDSIYEMLQRNELTKNDIKMYCLSQFAKSNIDHIQKTLEEPEHKFPFIGDVFGYTGLTSPFIAFKHAIDNNKIKRGDYVILWTIGAGIVTSGCLIRY